MTQRIAGYWQTSGKNSLEVTVYGRAASDHVGRFSLRRQILIDVDGANGDYFGVILVLGRALGLVKRLRAGDKRSRRNFLETNAMKLSTIALAAGLFALKFSGAWAQQEAGVPTLEAPAGTPAELPPNPSLRVLNDNPANLPIAHAAVNAATLCGASTTGSIPLWADSVHPSSTLGGGTDTFCMVGTDPIRGSNVKTTVPTVIVPLVVTFMPQNITFDPTTRDTACEPNSALNLTLLSPIYKNSTLKVGADVVGSGQYVGNFQRANFFRFTQTHTAFTLALTQTIKVQDVTAKNYPNPINTSCPHGTGHLGFLEISKFDAFVQGTLFPTLKAELKPNTFPIFLLYNVVLYMTTPSNCCVLGYHNAFMNPNYSNEFQTYGVVDFDMSTSFFGPTVSDVSTMSHEVGEWLDDPTTGNLTPLWGHIGQVLGCQNNLEVGDPLSAHIYPITLSGFTYHVQDLAFFSWFYRHTATMTGVSGTIGNFGSNGWFSLFGTTPFKTADAGALCK
jgi:hypothetical protein